MVYNLVVLNAVIVAATSRVMFFFQKNDVEQAINFLSVSEEEFIEKYCTIVDIGFFKKVSLQEKSNYDCIFWQDGLGCAIYEARPLQCRSYPFWPSVMESRQSPGIMKQRNVRV